MDPLPQEHLDEVLSAVQGTLLNFMDLVMEHFEHKYDIPVQQNETAISVADLAGAFHHARETLGL